MIWYRKLPGPGLMLAPVVFVMIMMLALGLGTLLAALNVAYRDFKYMIPFLIQIGLFATPTVYMDPADTASGGYAWILALNPMTTLVASFRSTMLDGPIAWQSITLAITVSVLMLITGFLYFRKVQDSFADVV